MFIEMYILKWLKLNVFFVLRIFIIKEGNKNFGFKYKLEKNYWANSMDQGSRPQNLYCKYLFNIWKEVIDV